MAATSRTLPRDPKDWTLDDAKSIPARSYPNGVIDDTAARATASYIAGDHYQNGDAWIGAGFDSAGVWVTSSKERFKKTLTPVPEMFACLERRVSGGCGNEADPGIAPKDPAGEPDENGNREPSKEQMTAMEEWRRDVGTVWWTDVGLWGGKDLRHPTGVRGMVAQASASESGSACLRAFINPAARTLQVRTGDGQTEKRVPRQQDRAAALRHIKLSTPPPDRCCIYVDPDTHQRTGVFLYKDFSDNDAAEIWYAAEQGDRTVTILRSLTADSDTETVYPWGGLLPIAQANVGCLITDAVRRLQAALDLAGTSLVRLIQAHGYGQRTEIGAEEDGYWSTVPPTLSNPGELPDARHNAATGQTEYFTPLPADMQSDVIRHLLGHVYQSGVDANGNPTYGITTPSVSYHEPSDPEAIIKGIDALTMVLRNACHQGHVRAGLLGSTAEASGEAYEQSRAPFVADVKAVGEAVDAPVAELLTCVTVMADYMTGATEPNFANDFSVSVQSHPSAGPPSTEWQNTTLAMVNGELLSPEEGTARLGVQDVAAERDRIAQARTLDRVAKIVEAAAKAASAGLNVTQVLIEAGVPEKDIPAWIQTDGPPNIKQ